ncbi:MAG: murein hydrolase activator EnvC family protein [bacterium]
MTRSRPWRLALVALLAVGLWPAAPHAQDTLESQKRRELEAIRRQAQEKRAQAGALKGQETRALNELRRTERQLSASRRRIRSLQTRRARLDQQLELTRANLQRSTESLSQQRKRLALRLRHMYMTGPTRDLEVLLSTRSFADLLVRWEYRTMIAQQDRSLLENVRAEKALVEQNERKLQGNIEDVSRTAKSVTVENRKLSGLRQKHATNERQIQTRREDYEAAAAQLERNARALQALLARLERQRRAEADKARGQGRDPQPYSGDFARGQGALDWPVRGEVVGTFGIETHPRFGTQVRNEGIDIRVAVGTAVRAVAKGRVDAADDDYGGAGGLVVLNHGDGYYTIYSHLSEVGVALGREVAAGAVIGRSGEEGSLKGPILHFEVRKGSSALDPRGWLR